MNDVISALGSPPPHPGKPAPAPFAIAALVIRPVRPMVSTTPAVLGKWFCLVRSGIDRDATSLVRYRGWTSVELTPALLH
ncbi:hypothetical protein CKAH01_09669 [Colletotrichum kahawae]|uniref:Uncharacterized protein n=1 Tax=Colletotrichum kahawae TaxID=34407 RepID=A0AAD9XZI4_COLKA|nr:hypothetical protein CKAH01_09669 [Colletotrichum kahawae]